MAIVTPRWVPIAALADFGATRKLVRVVDGVEILLLRSGGSVFAVRNRCTHFGERLDGGRIMAGQVICPAHGACFDVQTGKALSGPAVARLERYPVRIEAGHVEVEMPGVVAD